MNKPTKTAEVRFWEKVEVRGPDDCWVFKAGRTKGGYGVFRVTTQESMYAHRFAWLITHGEIPKAFQVQHRCDNPPCCNPDHLKLGTYADNANDMVARGRHRPGRIGWTHGGGENAPTHKLNQNQVDQIRQLLKGKRLLHREIAEQFGIGVSAVDHINTGRSWVHSHSNHV